MKFLITGLGNHGLEYRDTRHNIGFRVVDELAGSSTVFQPDRYAERAEVRVKGRTLVLIKPQTYMNLSGKAVRYWLEHEAISVERSLVITDDIALPFGRLRLRGAGSDGGHNGLAHIVECLGHASFPRLRFGVDNDFPRGAQANYVLSPWSEQESAELPAHIQRAVDAAKDFVLMGLEHAMNTFNR